MSWVVEDHPELGEFEDELGAAAAAWSVTPAGGSRPRVRGANTVQRVPTAPPVIYLDAHGHTESDLNVGRGVCWVIDSDGVVREGTVGTGDFWVDPPMLFVVDLAKKATVGMEMFATQSDVDISASVSHLTAQITIKAFKENVLAVDFVYRVVPQLVPKENKVIVEATAYPILRVHRY